MVYRPIIEIFTVMPKNNYDPSNPRQGFPTFEEYQNSIRDGNSRPQKPDDTVKVYLSHGSKRVRLTDIATHLNSAVTPTRSYQLTSSSQPSLSSIAASETFIIEKPSSSLAIIVIDAKTSYDTHGIKINSPAATDEEIITGFEPTESSNLSQDYDADKIVQNQSATQLRSIRNSKNLIRSLDQLESKGGLELIAYDSETVIENANQKIEKFTEDIQTLFASQLDQNEAIPFDQNTIHLSKSQLQLGLHRLDNSTYTFSSDSINEVPANVQTTILYAFDQKGVMFKQSSQVFTPSRNTNQSGGSLNQISTSIETFNDDIHCPNHGMFYTENSMEEVGIHEKPVKAISIKGIGSNISRKFNAKSCKQYR